MKIIFKVGDDVTPIKSIEYAGLYKGKVYKVISVSHSQYDDKQIIGVKSAYGRGDISDGTRPNWVAWAFTLCKPAPKTILPLP